MSVFDKLLKQEEDALSQNIPSFINRPTSPSQLLKDYATTGDPLLKEEAKQSYSLLKTLSSKAKEVKDSILMNKENSPSQGTNQQTISSYQPQRSPLGNLVSQLPDKISKPLLSVGEKAQSFISPPSFSDLMVKALDEDNSRSTIELETRAKELAKEEGIIFTSSGKSIQIDPTGMIGSVKNIAAKPLNNVFKGFDDISTNVLERLQGKGTVSKIYIENTLNQPGIREADKVMVKSELDAIQGDKVNVQELADRVKENQILPLNVLRPRKEYGDSARLRYENIALPDSIRGPVARYDEHIYESPIKTSAGDVHFGSDIPNYFAHSRVEDLAAYPGIAGNSAQGTNGTRRVIEIQSDLFQKGRLDDSVRSRRLDTDRPNIFGNDEWEDLNVTMQSEIGSKENFQKLKGDLTGDINKLKPYENTWHERIVREEIKQAGKDGMTKVQFPTGETAMKIEGLGGGGNAEGRIWTRLSDGEDVFPEDYSKFEVGEVLGNQGDGKEWVITDLVGDGKFKATQKDSVFQNHDTKKLLKYGDEGWLEQANKRGTTEEFDISGEIDEANPIYKFYEDKVQKFLNKNFEAKRVVDDKGVEWVEVDLTPDIKNKPVLAHGFASNKALLGGSALGVGAIGAGSILDKIPGKTIEYANNTQPTSIFEQDTQSNMRQSRDEFKNALIHTENRGAVERGEDLYTTIGVTGDLGKYQVKPNTLNDWSGPWLGKKLTPQEFLSNPQAQEQFFNEFIAMVDKLELSDEEAAIAWHKGWGDMGQGPKEERSKVFKKGLKERMKTPEAQEYLQTFNQAL